MIKHIDLAGERLPCRLTTGSVAETLRYGEATTVQMDANGAIQTFELKKVRVLDRLEHITVIELQDPRTGQWQPVALASHDARTWSFDVDPRAFLAETGLARRKPSQREVTACSAVGAACLIGTLSGAPSLFLTPVLLPIALYAGLDFFLRRNASKRLARLITMLDILASEVMGPRKWSSHFVAGATRRIGDQ